MRFPTNVAGSRMRLIPGIAGWHHSAGRIFVRMADGSTVTIRGDKTRAELQAEARRLRTRASILDAWASDKEDDDDE